MKKKHELYLLFVVAVFMISVLGGCSSNATKTSDNGNGKGKQSVVSSAASTDTTLHLSITSGCVGCGHCIRIDPAHFSQAQGSRTPQVVSQSNLDSSDLQRAINGCRAGAISLAS